MKAKQWAARLAAADDMSAVLQDFVAEIGEIAAKRGGSMDAVEGAVREQRAKWRAVCLLRGSLNQDGFEIALAAFGPRFKTVEEFVRKRDKKTPLPSVRAAEEVTDGRKLAAEVRKYRPFALRLSEIK